MSCKKYRVSADIGGTFTDLVFYDTETGEYLEGKTLTTPNNRSDAVISGIDEKITNYEDIEFFVHGTTSGLNAFLERKGERVALLTTEGFRDVYEIARGNRPGLYEMRYRKPQPLIERMDIFEVKERMMGNGETRLAVQEDSIAAAAEKIRQGDYTSVAVCFLHSYNNPAHELQAREYLEKHLPGYSISLSHQVAREWREYERTSTTVINAYIAPIVQSYLNSLERRMADKSFEKHVHIMQSGGGIITAEIAKATPIQTLMSGPVGGAVGNQTLSEMLGYPNLIGVDMGGTSYDVSIVVDGKPDISNEVQLEGFPILVPMVNIHTIGAGGGSIAWIEAGGLRVGPKSAGSVPGPACYGRGGTQPTITDANTVLGRLVPDGFLGGGMKLDKEAAEKAVATVAKPLGMTVTQAAEGICAIADAKMADAIRQLTIRKGIDPREFVLVAFGGAGPMQACTTARELDIDRVLVPEMPGIFSAWGMLQSDIRQDLSRTMQCNLARADVSEIAAKFDDMTAEAMDLLERQHITRQQAEFVRSAEMRYLGQEHTLRVNLPMEGMDEDTVAYMVKSFHDLHLQIYGHNDLAGDVEIVNLRLVGLGRLAKIAKKKCVSFSTQTPTPIKTQDIIFDGESCTASIYTRKSLECGQTFSGPAIVEELTTTTVVPPGWQVTIDEYRNMMIQRKNREEVAK